MDLDLGTDLEVCPHACTRKRLTRRQCQLAKPAAEFCPEFLIARCGLLNARQCQVELGCGIPVDLDGLLTFRGQFGKQGVNPAGIPFLTGESFTPAFELGHQRSRLVPGAGTVRERPLHQQTEIPNQARAALGPFSALHQRRGERGQVPRTPRRCSRLAVGEAPFLPATGLAQIVMTGETVVFGELGPGTVSTRIGAGSK